MAISGMKRKRRGRPKGSKNHTSTNLNPSPFNPEIPAQDQPILAETNPANPNPANPNPQPENLLGGNANSFEAEVANIPATVGDVPGPEAGGDIAVEAGGGVPLSPALSRFAEAIGPEAVRGWINIPFEALAVAVDHPEMSLEEWELTIWAPAMSSVLERYLPSLLQKTNHPEFAALGMCAATYCISRYKVISDIWQKPKSKAPDVLKAPEPVKAAGPMGVSTMAASPAL